ncbi:hypothetical protein CU097_003072, partial [Rhizopus azygosporus]
IVTEIDKKDSATLKKTDCVMMNMVHLFGMSIVAHESAISDQEANAHHTLADQLEIKALLKSTEAKELEWPVIKKDA